MSEKLHLVRLVFTDPLASPRLAGELGMPEEQPFDPDYVHHSILGELFGAGKVQPFVQDPRKRSQAILGYSPHDIRALHERAQAVAPPEIHGAIDWEASRSKPLPTTWRLGMRLGFRVRACPLVRGPSAHGSNGCRTKKRRPEVDAYLAHCWREERPSKREDVYRKWLEGELARWGAAQMESSRLKSFRLIRALRRRRDRQLQGITRPEALFHGVLRILDPEAFTRLLSRGLGRHRSFGFGMLLLTGDARQQ